MEELTAPAPQAPAISVRHDLRFEGSGGEYFKIWIVNLALTIVTLGIFSAWAKVRNKRYFYGNTFIDQHAFDYHASPWRILLGRAIAFGLLLSYSITIAMAPRAAFLWVIVFIVALPWLVKTSLRFNARNTSYRNIRFDFTGTYFGALKAFVLWPIAAAFTLFILMPLAHRARDYYNINFHSFGGKPFHAEIPAGKLYAIYLLGLVFILGVFALAGAAIIHLHLTFPTPNTTLNPAAMMPIIILFSAAYIVTLLFLVSFIGTMTLNLALNHTTLADTLKLQSHLSPFAMTWIIVSNLALTLVTLGLFYPWAHVRIFRYMAGRMAIAGPGNLDGFTSDLPSRKGVVGEEIASFFNIDIGL